MKTFNLCKVMLLTLLVSYTSRAQTPSQRAQISNDYNEIRLMELKDRLLSQQQDEKEKALEEAVEKGWQTKYSFSNGSGFAELVKIGPTGNPIYYQTHNVDAATSTRTDHLNSNGSLGLNLDGQGMTAYVWDGGATRTTHQEFDGAGGSNRVTQGDGASSYSDHATHVIGTILASGFQPSAKGMAPHSQGMAYDWNNDLSEMTNAAAAGMLISNHSYGYGWRNSSGQVQLPSYYGGAYIRESSDVDEIMYNAPYYLMVSSAGNDGDDNSANVDPLDGNSSFDKLTAYSTAKNNLVVAAANDVNTNSDGTINGSVSITYFSSEGPTDDYRIKPDITGNGWGLYSSVAGSNSSYSSYSGTSMSGPNVAGTLLLLQQHYNNVNGAFMKAATLKGLALHTADDAGISGPDAIYGWGLLNAKEMAEAISDNGAEVIIDELTLSQGDSYQLTVTASGGPLLASISWTDPEGTINRGTINLSTPVLVNDLDIRVTQGNTTNLPYALTGVNSNAKQDNIVDPFERVDVANASGTYTITVTHKGSLFGSSQDFSLIVTGASTGASCDLSAPANFTASNVNDNSFGLSWNSVSEASSYTVTVGGVSSTLTGTSYTASGLIAGTTYACEVVANCADGGTGVITSLNVTTTGTTPISCSGSAITSYPYTEGFENGDGWTQITGDDGDWHRDANGTPSSNTGPDGAIEGDYYLFLEASTNGSTGQIGNNATAVLESPCFDLAGMESAYFSFQNHMYGASVGSIYVEIATGDNNWMELWNQSGDQGDQWNSVEIDLADYLGEVVKIRFIGTTGDGWSSDIAIDDIALKASLGGSSGSCTSTISSIPYSEGFESGDGWIQIDGDDGNWYRDANGTPSNNTGPGNAFEGDYYLFLEASTNGSAGQIGNNATAILESPCIDLTNQSSAYFSFQNHMYGSSVGSLTVQLSDEDDNWVDVWSLSGSQGNQWNGISIDLADYLGSFIKIRLVGSTGNGWSSDIAIDDLAVTETGITSSVTCTTEISSFPYTEGFESGDGWLQIGEDDGDWYRDANGTPSNNTGPESALEGNYYMFLEASTNGSAGQIGNDATAILESPCFNLSGVNNATFSFANHMYGNSVGTLTVQATNDDENWTSLWSVSGNQGNQWNTVSIDLSAYAGSTIKLRIIGTTGNGWSSDITIDNISLQTGIGVNTTSVQFETESVEDAEEATTDYTIYPNPVVGGDLNVMSVKGSALFRILNLSGKSIMIGEITNNKIDVSGLAEGFYLLEINDEENIIIQKFMRKE